MENEKPEECDACSFETDNLNYYEHGAGYPKGAGQWLCEVCWQTKSGNANRAPHAYHDPDALHMIAYCTNLILSEIRKEQERK